MASNFAALWSIDIKFLAIKDLNPFKTVSKAQKTSSILRMGFAQSKWPHFISTYLLRVPYSSGIAVKFRLDWTLFDRKHRSCSPRNYNLKWLSWQILHQIWLLLKSKGTHYVAYSESLTLWSIVILPYCSFYDAMLISQSFFNQAKLQPVIAC